jgi:S-adenosylmethionine synthetase
VSDDLLTTAVREVFALSPLGIIEYLDLLRPIYRQTAAFGHFGRDVPDFTWEKTHRTADLRTACGL